MRMVEAHPTFGDGSLSPDLEAAAARRLGALALVVAGISATMGTIEIAGGVPSALGPRARAGFMAVAVVVSCALHAAISRRWVGTRRALALGLGFEAVTALLTAVPFHAMSLLPGIEVRGWTPVATWMLVYPLVVPGRTRRVVIASLVTAAMDPLGLWLAVVAGAPAPPAAALGRIFLSTFLAAVLVPIAARVVYGMALEVKRAREMGSYRLIAKIGEGGMGEVWRAEHRMLARGAAIKLIRPAALGAPTGSHADEILKRFEREAQATAGLRSPHTIELYDYGIAADGTFHYVMELLDGYSLQTLVERFGPLPPERVVRLLRQACHSLAEAHAAGLVHRDVKPANIFVCRLGLDVDFVKVLDFGLVKVQGRRAAGEDELTAAGSFTGTPAYMPPEVALGARGVDARADIYALGCVAYWLLTGHLVFDGASAMQMVVDHVRTPPIPPSRRATREIPQALERIVLRCLEKDPARRPVSVAALSRELQWLGIEGRWTEGRAREWWKARDAAGVVEEASLVDLPTLRTQSMHGRLNKGNVMRKEKKEKSMTSRMGVAAYVLVAGLGVGAGSAAAQEVTVDYDRRADLSRPATYTWAEGQPAENPFADRNIVEAVDRALAGRGWSKVERDPSYFVRYHASVREDKSLQVWDGRRPFFGGMASLDIKTVVNGMLVVDIMDAAGGLVWRAVARDTVSDKPEKNRKKLDRAMEKMFGSFPPAAGR